MPRSAARATELVTRDANGDGQFNELHEVHWLPEFGRTVRVRVHYDDGYQRQSWATAEMLTPDWWWEEIARFSPTSWPATIALVKRTSVPRKPNVYTLDPADVAAALKPVVDTLLTRAHAVLTAARRPATEPAAATRTRRKPTTTDR